MPEVQFAGTRQSEQANATDAAAGISHAVIQDVSGRLYDIFVSSNAKGQKRLHDRARAAWVLQKTKGLAALGFAHEEMLKFVPGSLSNKANQTNHANQANQQDSTNSQNQNELHFDSIGEADFNNPTVLICNHLNGNARELSLLTTDDCVNAGTAIGAIHRLSPSFLTKSDYPSFTTGQIRTQLTSWIKRLRQAGHIPTEITDNWSRVLETDGLWSFDTCPVHGGFKDGDFLFSGSTITAITNWQSMQINDPARDLAWIFAKLNEQHRNALLSAYGRMLGSRLDSMIMLRANLWLQMEQVGDFIQALQRADTTGIMRFKAQVERLAHELTRINNSRAASANQNNNSANPASSLTVGDIVKDDIVKDNAVKDDTISSDATNEKTVVTLKQEDQKDYKDNTYEQTITINDNTNATEAATKTATIADGLETQVISSVNKTNNVNNNSTNEVNDSNNDFVDKANANNSVESADSGESADSNNSVESVDINSNDGNGNNSNGNNGNKNEDLDKPATIIIPMLKDAELAIKDAKSKLESTRTSANTGESTNAQN
ncbi:phosphotransferase [Gardnerella sp. DNF01199S]|uniref:phosphotransferase n=1 Tax=Gardnerella sp. DNF01199S TaxID=2749067 RepID=UPI003BA99806